MQKYIISLILIFSIPAFTYAINGNEENKFITYILPRAVSYAIYKSIDINKRNKTYFILSYENENYIVSPCYLNENTTDNKFVKRTRSMLFLEGKMYPLVFESDMYFGTFKEANSRVGKYSVKYDFSEKAKRFNRKGKGISFDRDGNLISKDYKFSNGNKSWGKKTITYKISLPPEIVREFGDSSKENIIYILPDSTMKAIQKNLWYDNKSGYFCLSFYKEGFFLYEANEKNGDWVSRYAIKSNRKLWLNGKLFSLIFYTDMRFGTFDDPNLILKRYQAGEKVLAVREISPFYGGNGIMFIPNGKIIDSSDVIFDDPPPIKSYPIFRN